MLRIHPIDDPSDKGEIVQPMKSIMQRNSCKIMQVKTYEMGPALLPFASYKPLWASPRSMAGTECVKFLLLPL